jgi:hypothetical protein
MLLENNPYHVYLIFDEEYGKNIYKLAIGWPAWIIESSTNYPIVKELWQKNDLYRNHLTGLTCFQKNGYDSYEDLLLSMIESIEDHHGIYSHNPEYTILEIIGLGLSDQIQDRLRDYGFYRFELTDQGFVAFKNISKSYN